MSTLLIKNGTCVLPSGLEKADILIKNGKIEAIGKIGEKADQTIDAKGLHVLPGLIDTQVHFREPGLEHKEDLEHGTRGAVLGGVTGVFEMPNTNPPTITKAALEDKLNRASKKAWCNYAFYVGGTPDHDVDWHALEMLPGCAGIKIFMGSSTGSLLVAEDEALRRILSQTTRRVAIHSEDEARLKERYSIAQEGGHPRFHPIWRDEIVALRSTERLLKIAKELGKQVHVLHVTTAEELTVLAHYKEVASVECLPQHLTFTDTDYETLGTRLQMNPPIRAKKHQDALWQAIREGVVDVLGSDHAPHTLEEKAKPYPQSPSGMPGVQTIVPVMLHHVNEGKLSLQRLVDLMCYGPARLFGLLGKGRLAKGFDADITIVDMKHKYRVKDTDMATKSQWTPLDGYTLKGSPTHTIIGGHVVMSDGHLHGVPVGRPFTFASTLNCTK